VTEAAGRTAAGAKARINSRLFSMRELPLPSRTPGGDYALTKDPIE
jgi:hypothetical protein